MWASICLRAVRSSEVERRDDVPLDDGCIDRQLGVSVLQRPGRDAEEHYRALRAIRRFDDRDPIARPCKRIRLRDADEAEVPCCETLA